MATAVSNATSLILNTTAVGPTSALRYAEASGDYSGTWRFEWQPATPTDWPGDYTITSIRQQSYATTVPGGTAEAKVAVTGGSTLADAIQPTTSTSSYTSPAPTVNTNTSDPNLTVTTRDHSWHLTRAVSNGSAEQSSSVTIVKRAYTANYFTNHFSSPSSVVLTFAVTPIDLTARVDLSSSSTSSPATASASVSDLFFGTN
jgi:hypothetical protein